jgi:hypothetical protein
MEGQSVGLYSGSGRNSKPSYLSEDLERAQPGGSFFRFWGWVKVKSPDSK